MNRRELFSAAAAVVATGAAVKASAAAAGDRISCERGDPGERLFAKLCGDDLDVRVFLDGAPQDGVITADPGKGYIKRQVRTEDGNVAFNRVTSEVFTEEVYGDVRWEASPLR